MKDGYLVLFGVKDKPDVKLFIYRERYFNSKYEVD